MIERAVIVVSHENSPWLSDCLVSLKGLKYPVIVCMNTHDDNGYDPAGLYLAKQLGIQHFWLLHDSMIVKNKSHVEKKLETPGCYCENSRGLMFIAKYQLDQMPELPPKPRTKEEAVRMEGGYQSRVPWSSHGSNFDDNPRRTFLHGRTRMVIENENFIKYKAHWNIESVNATDRAGVPEY